VFKHVLFAIFIPIALHFIRLRFQQYQHVKKSGKPIELF
jgi:hypothetical protein